MKKFLLIACTVMLASACKTTDSSTKTSPGQNLKNTKIEDFVSFIGIEKGDEFEHAKKLFGKPTKIDPHDGKGYSFTTCYYDDATGNRMFSYTYDKKANTVNHIRLTGKLTNNHEETKRYLISRGVKDAKMNFLGMHKDDIIKIFGKADRVSSDNYEYNRGKINVTFICYDFHGYRCSEIYLHWNMY